MFPTCLGANFGGAQLRPNLPKLHHFGHCWTPVGLKFGPSWSQVARVRRKLSPSWAQVGSCSAQLEAKDGPCSSPLIPNYHTPQLQKVVPDLHTYIIRVRAVLVVQRLEYHGFPHGFPRKIVYKWLMFIVFHIWRFPKIGVPPKHPC